MTGNVFGGIQQIQLLRVTSVENELSGAKLIKRAMKQSDSSRYVASLEGEVADGGRSASAKVIPDPGSAARS